MGMVEKNKEKMVDKQGAIGRGKSVAIVVSRFNEFITNRLLAGCLDELDRSGQSACRRTVVWVPGAYELPVTALCLARQKNVDAVICLGAVIRGETFHFELVAQGAAQGIMNAALATEKPVIFGVLTTDTINQAYKRSEEDGDNKGREAAQTALEMIDVLKAISR